MDVDFSDSGENQKSASSIRCDFSVSNFCEIQGIVFLLAAK